MRQIKAAEVMNAKILTVTEGMSVSELATFLVDHEISGAPVEDASGQLVGVVSLTDVARATSEKGGERQADERHHFFLDWQDEKQDDEELEELQFETDELEVRDIMTPTVFAVEADSTVAHVARTMLEGHLHRLLVLQGTRVVGIISTSDLLRLLSGANGD